MEWKSEIYGGNKRRLYNIGTCICGEILWSRLSRHKKFCSTFCSWKASRDYIKIVCPQCHKEVERPRGRLRGSKSGILFCSRKCKDTAQRLGGIKEIQPVHYGRANGKCDYRQRALEHHGIACTNRNCPIRSAGISIPERMLDVDHIDENRFNNAIENLQVLCVWCHANKTRRIGGWKVFGKII